MKSLWRRVVLCFGLTGIVISALLWVISWYWVVEGDWVRGANSYSMYLVPGDLLCVRENRTLPSSWSVRPHDNYLRVWATAWLPSIEHRIGGIMLNPHDLPMPTTRLLIPIWIPLVMCLVLLPIGVWRRAPRIDECLHCGYSLIGNKSGVCPECGSSVTRTES